MARPRLAGWSCCLITSLTAAPVTRRKVGRAWASAKVAQTHKREAVRHHYCHLSAIISNGNGTVVSHEQSATRLALPLPSTYLPGRCVLACP